MSCGCKWLAEAAAGCSWGRLGGSEMPLVALPLVLYLVLLLQRWPRPHLRLLLRCWPLLLAAAAAAAVAAGDSAAASAAAAFAGAALAVVCCCCCWLYWHQYWCRCYPGCCCLLLCCCWCHCCCHVMCFMDGYPFNGAIIYTDVNFLRLL